MRSRLLIAVPGIAIAIVGVAAGGVTFALVALAIALLGLLELQNLLAEFRPIAWPASVGAAAIVLLPLVGNSPERQLLVGVATIVALAVVAALTVADRDEITLRAAIAVFSGLYVGLPLGVLVAMRTLPNGADAVAVVLVGVWSFDTLSYVGGRLWGQTPIAPRTSPKKTWEGFAVGLVGGTLAVFVAQLYLDWLGALDAVILGVVICLAAYVGDLFESLIKRDVGVKDSGRILLGHGGILDRFDALFFAAPVAYLAITWLVT
ncbi:MAG: CDP-archaeol synthase [Actinobacteria bacterium]|nr:CDP-archaeol synthase [Actinomycetota bacterium]